MDKYGDEIEADLQHHYRVDLLDFFRGRRSWRQLLNFIQKLPSSSLTTEAMADDDELAALMADRPVTNTGPRLSEYTAEVARLDIILDRLSELISVTLQLNGGKAPRLRPAKRPETAYARLQRRRTEDKLGSLIAEVEAAQQRSLTKTTE